MLSDRDKYTKNWHFY